MAGRYGDGSVFYDEARGRWVGVLDLGRDASGRRRRKKVSAKTPGRDRKGKAEVVAAMRALARERDEGTVVTGRPLTLAAWLDIWCDDILPGTVEASTERQYRQVCRTWITPHLGTVPLAKLAPEHVDRMMRALADADLSVTTQRMARTILRRALGVAMRYGKVSRNVVTLTDPPKQKGGAKLDDALDATDAQAVLTAAQGDPWEALAVLALTLGLRQGELIRLRWEDVNLDQAVLVVRKAKTEASTGRRVALPDFAVAALRRHRAAQREQRMAAPAWVDPDLIFTTRLGQPLTGRAVWGWWQELCKKAKVGRRRFHASRHTAATLMLNNGVPLEVVSATLGHAGLAITSNIYAKVRPELQRKAATAMDQVLGGA